MVLYFVKFITLLKDAMIVLIVFFSSKRFQLIIICCTRIQ